MSYDEAETEILTNVKTRQDQVRLLAQLDELNKDLYKTAENSWENSLNSKINADLAEIISHLVQAGEEPKQLLRKLIDAVKNLETIKITFAVNPSKDMLTKIYQWIAKNVSAGIILETNINESIMAGAQISYRGKYGDYSIRNKWEEYWKRRSEI